MTMQTTPNNPDAASRDRWCQEASNLVRLARKTLAANQAQFGKIVGRSQTLVSKYEQGKVLPPADVVMQCMHMVHGPTFTHPEISTDTLIRRLKQVSADPRYASALTAIAALLDL